MSMGISAATWGMIGVGASVGGSLLGANAASNAADAQAEGAAQADNTQRYMYDQTRRDNAPFLGNGTAANNQLAYLLGIGGGQGAAGAAPNTYIPGQSGNALWEKVLGDFNTEHTAAYGMGMNRDWNSDPQAMQTKATLDQRYGSALASDPAYQAQMAQQQQSGSGYGSLMRNISRQDIESDPVYSMGTQFGLDEGRKAIERQASATGSQLSGATMKALTRFGTDYGTQKAGEASNRITGQRQNQYNMLAGVSGTGQVAGGQTAQAGQGYANAVGQNALAVGNARGASGIAGANAINNGLGQAWNGYQTNQLLSRLPQLNGGQQWGSAYNPGGFNQPLYGPGGEA